MEILAREVWIRAKAGDALVIFSPSPRIRIAGRIILVRSRRIGDQKIRSLEIDLQKSAVSKFWERVVGNLGVT